MFTVQSVDDYRNYDGCHDQNERTAGNDEIQLRRLRRWNGFTNNYFNTHFYQLHAAVKMCRQFRVD